MMADLLPLLERREVQLGALVLGTLVGLLVARKVRKVARSPRPDDALSNLAMLVGLGWSSEAAWVLTGRAHFPTSLRLLLFFVMEMVLVVSMIRAKRAMKTLNHPGRSGRTAWVVATGMALVAVGVAGSFAEGVLRLLIPLLITNMWWDGLIGEGARKRLGATSWRWTPRRLLLWLGAIEPGERDVESVHRERLIQTMTRLEFDRRHGLEKRRDRAARKLAKLSLSADDAVVGAVRDRVDRATWFKTELPAEAESAPPVSISAAVAASARARRVRHGRSLRRVMVAHPRPVIIAAQEVRADDRAAHERDLVVRAVKETLPALPQRQIARLTALPETSVRASIRRISKGPAAQSEKANGRVPDLEEAR